MACVVSTISGVDECMVGRIVYAKFVCLQNQTKCKQNPEGCLRGKRHPATEL